MENSSKEKLIEDLSSKLEAQIERQNDRRFWVTVNPSKIVESCSQAHGMGFEHLSTIAATDWVEEGKFGLTYHLWSYKYNILLTIKTKIDRKNPTIPSVNSIWDTYAETCERECHELFGIKFTGNKNLTPLFLEEWEGPPPFLKDFNWREYVTKEVYDTKNPREEAYFEVKK